MAKTAIPDKLYFKIGEVANLAEVKPYVLRYWETEFKELAPTKSRSGQRLYKRRDVELVLYVKDLLHHQRFTIEGARKLIGDFTSGAATPPIESVVVEEKVAPIAAAESIVISAPVEAPPAPLVMAPAVDTAELEALSAEIELLRVKADAIDAEFAAQKAGVAEVLRQLGDAQIAASEAQDRLAQVEIERENVEAELAALKDENGQFLSELENVRQLQVDTVALLEQTKAELVMIKEMPPVVAVDAGALEARIATLESELAEAGETRRQIESELSRARTANALSEKEAREFRELLSSIRVEVQDMFIAAGGNVEDLPESVVARPVKQPERVMDPELMESELGGPVISATAPTAAWRTS